MSDQLGSAKDGLATAPVVAYRHMERFIGTVENAQAAEEVWRAIKGKGAFRYFKDTARRLGLLDQWYRYRDEAVKEYVIA